MAFRRGFLIIGRMGCAHQGYSIQAFISLYFDIYFFFFFIELVGGKRMPGEERLSHRPNKWPVKRSASTKRLCEVSKKMEFGAEAIDWFAFSQFSLQFFFTRASGSVLFDKMFLFGTYFFAFSHFFSVSET